MLAVKKSGVRCCQWLSRRKLEEITFSGVRSGLDWTRLAPNWTNLGRF